VSPSPGHMHKHTSCALVYVRHYNFTIIIVSETFYTHLMCCLHGFEASSMFWLFHGIFSSSLYSYTEADIYKNGVILILVDRNG